MKIENKKKTANEPLSNQPGFSSYHRVSSFWFFDFNKKNHTISSVLRLEGRLIDWLGL